MSQIQPPIYQPPPPQGYYQQPPVMPPAKKGVPVWAWIVAGLVLVAAAAAIIILVVIKKDNTPLNAAIATPAAKSGELDIASIKGVKEVALDPSLFAEMNKTIPGIKVKMYVSDDDMAKLADKVDAEVIRAGYKFDLPGFTKPTEQNGGLSGFYTKGENADVLMAVADMPEDGKAFVAALNLPGLTQEAGNKIIEQVKGKKIVAVVVTTPGVMNQLIKGFSAAATTPTPQATKK